MDHTLTRPERRRADNLAARMSDLVGSVAILSAELNSSRRQQASLQMLLGSAEAAVAAKHPGGAGATPEEAAELRAQLKEWAVFSTRQVKELREIDGSAPFENRKSTVRWCVEEDGTLARQDSTLTEESFTGAMDTAEVEAQLTAGSAAVNVARAERQRATRLALEITRLKEQKEQLLDKLDFAAGQTLGAFPATSHSTRQEQHPFSHGACS